MEGIGAEVIEGLEGIKRKVINVITPDTKAYQIIPIRIDRANQVQKIYTETKMDHKKIIGVFGSSTSDFGIIGSTLDLSIDEKEVFPEGFEASLINRQVGVGINELPYKIERKALNSKIKATYTDGGNYGTIYPYTYNLYLVATKE